MNKKETAAICFNKGFNCAQAVFSSYCEEFGLNKDLALLTASGFGAGMGRLQEVCGAVTGAFMVLSLKYGSVKENETESKERLYNAVQEFNKRFKEKNGAINCKALLGIDLIKGDKKINSERINAICPNLIRNAVEILEEMLS